MFYNLTPEEYTEIILDIAYFRSNLTTIPMPYRSYAAVSLLIEVAIDLIINEPERVEEVLYSDNLYFWYLLRDDINERGL